MLALQIEPSAALPVPLRVSRPVRPERESCSGHRFQAEDSHLIREAQKGNAEGFAELVRRYDKPVLRLALHFTRSERDAQDAYQDTFLKAYRNITRFRFECSFYTWIYRIAVNVCLDHIRRKRNQNEVSTIQYSSDGQSRDLLDYLPDHRPRGNPERSVLNRELTINISRALEKLSPRERVVFELKHFQGMRLRTVAGILEITEGTAKNRLFRATRKLRLALAEMR
jgi:RNA polymerase sigma-70 factor, ECF subfamily